jgi:hypothetical protein
MVVPLVLIEKTQSRSSTGYVYLPPPNRCAEAGLEGFVVVGLLAPLVIYMRVFARGERLARIDLRIGSVALLVVAEPAVAALAATLVETLLRNQCHGFRLACICFNKPASCPGRSPSAIPSRFDIDGKEGLNPSSEAGDAGC